ncbi:16S rRNA (cytidine(1402)-2'-O)-methyltransferase [Occultella glacieicola]|uniref:Ribosomal RNA small subunit methyltransferase I n=1 Tax=Occultella glacieicola TaxID=2518684 RepID=A0ABY2E5C8_9MICO|nr:16S rRNA (cytidine(1402)-2'-O)-methyltransferase [Occultella glacieicola]
MIVLAATPIGDTGDAPPRLVELLRRADLIAAEDTRRLRALAARLDVTLTSKVISYHEHNESERAQVLVAAAQEGDTVLVVSDAGMPGVSDPGFRVVRAAADAGVRVTAVPGPSAVLTAIALSGLASDRFTFEGFVARRPGERARALAALADEPRTMVFFESPHRIADTLAAMADAFGADRAAAVCRELTKTYEQVRRGPLTDLARWAADGVRGEITVVVAGATPSASEPADHVDEVLARIEAGERLKEAAATVAAAHGVSRRELYEAALRAR